MSNNSKKQQKAKRLPTLTSMFFMDCLLTLAVFYLYGSDLPPGANESHYLTKAKHYWDSTFLESDFFVVSANAHWFFFLTCGWLTKLFSFGTAAWIGRFAAWTIIASGWCHLARKFSDDWYAGTISSLPFLATLHWGHLSGEWVVGGFEAKCLAYGIALFAISFFLQGDHLKCWTLLGMSSAFHVLTGGWITFCIIISDFFFPLSKDCEQPKKPETSQNAWQPIKHFTKESPRFSRAQRWVKRNFSGWLCGGCIGLLGLVPALRMNMGVDSEVISQGYINQVYGRLSHHLVATHFESDRWLSHAIALAITAVISTILFRFDLNLVRRINPNTAKPVIIDSEVRMQPIWMNRTAFLFSLASIALMFACMGSLISYFGPFLSWQWTSGLLRFYWFRFNDVAWPLSLAMSLLTLWSVSKKNIQNENQIQSVPTTFLLAAILTILPGAWLLSIRFSQHYAQNVAVSDQRALGAPFYNENSQTVPRDWKIICSWIKENLPPETLTLTPLNQQNFKWYAERPEYYCFKDAPQNAVGVNEWQTRRYDSWFLLDRDQSTDELTNSVLNLAKKYSITHVVLDRTQFPRGLKLPVIYPAMPYTNRSFTLYQISHE